jgi:hypothetical protein
MPSSPTLQIRLPKKILEQVDSFVKQGLYSSRSDFLKEAVRKHVFELKQTGNLPYIVGPFTDEQLEILKSDPKESIFIDTHSMDFNI